MGAGFRLFIRAVAVFVLAAGMAVGMAGCGSSKKSVKTAQSDRTEQVKDYHTSKKHKSDTPAAVADALVSEARTWLGVPYRYGGHTREGADCSGFLMEVFKNALNVDLPRTTKDQRDHCLDVDRDNISVGDIIFFSSNSSSGKIAHVGMYVGDGRMIHASSSRGVVEDNLDLKYYVDHFRSIGRVPELAAAKPVPTKPKVEISPIRPIKTAAPTDTVPAVMSVAVPTDTIGSIVKNAFKK
jgi:lipoprotein Spr